MCYSVTAQMRRDDLTSIQSNPRPPTNGNYGAPLLVGVKLPAG